MNLVPKRSCVVLLSRYMNSFGNITHKPTFLNLFDTNPSSDTFFESKFSRV